MMYKNKEGYPDPTAGKAIKKADKMPDHVTWFVKTVKDIAGLVDLELIERVQVRDKTTGKEYR